MSVKDMFIEKCVCSRCGSVVESIDSTGYCVLCHDEMYKV